ncbi:hypothetical protein VPH35_053714 [Triticum aestivum]
MPVQQHSSSLAMELGVRAALSLDQRSPAMPLEPAQQHRRSVSSSLATELGVCAALGRLYPSDGVAVLPSTLLDEYERLAIEAQLSRAVLRRSYSEPSPSRIVALVREETAARRVESVEEGPRRAPCEPRARRPWLLEALKRVLCWLGGAWGGHGRSEEQQAMPMPPAPAPEPPRMRLLDYLR